MTNALVLAGGAMAMFALVGGVVHVCYLSARRMPIGDTPWWHKLGSYGGFFLVMLGILLDVLK